MIRFAISFLVFSAIIASPAWFLSPSGLGVWFDAGFWQMFAFFFVINAAVCISVIIGQRRDDKAGAQIFLAATVIKLLLSMVFALIFVLKNPQNKLHFVFSFFYLYFLNTAFEIFSLISNLRHLNKK